MGNVQLDEAILACCDHQWRKVARIMSCALDTSGLDSKSWGERALTKRLRVLVRKNEIEAAGNIYNWRASEIRLPKVP
jgi:hypothetical protein